MESFPWLEEEKEFDWRDRLRNPGAVPPEAAAKLDELADLVKKEGKDGEFLKDVGAYRHPALTLVQYFRDILNDAERKELFEAIEKANQSS